MCSIPLVDKHDAAVYFTATALLPARGAGGALHLGLEPRPRTPGHPASGPARPEPRAGRFRHCQPRLVLSCPRSVVSVSEILQHLDVELPAAVAAELGRLRPENARLLRLLKLTPQEAAPPGPGGIL